MSDAPLVYLNDEGVAVYRASGLYSCVKALTAVRMGYQTMAPPEKLAVRFQAGHDHEPSILRGLRAEGWDPVPGTDQADIEPIKVGSRALITGHVDRLAAHDHWGTAIVEAKAFAVSTWESWHARHWEAFPYYAWQVSIYMHSLGLPCLFAVKNKNTDEIHTTVVTEPLVPLGRIVAKILAVEKAAEAGELPVVCEPRTWPCPVWYLGCGTEGRPDLSPQDGATLARIEALAATYDAARGQAAKAEARRKEAARELAELLGQDGKVDTDAWAVSRATYSRTTLDRAKLAEAHPEIDLGEFERTTESTQVRVTRKGK